MIRTVIAQMQADLEARAAAEREAKRLAKERIAKADRVLSALISAWGESGRLREEHAPIVGKHQNPVAGYLFSHLGVSRIEENGDGDRQRTFELVVEVSGGVSQCIRQRRRLGVNIDTGEVVSEFTDGDLWGTSVPLYAKQLDGALDALLESL